jgi:F-type H+-transporting ATPase subunit alpha
LGDMSGYIQTNLMSMTDGHLFFDSDLFNQGRRPPINPFLSVTRVGLQAQSPLVRDLSRQVNSFLVKQEKLRQFMHFGAELSEEVRKEIDLGDRLTAFFDQPSTKVVPISISILVVAGLWAGWWRDLDIEGMKKELISLASTYKTTPEYKASIDKLIVESKSFSELVDQIKNNPSLVNRVAQNE